MWHKGCVCAKEGREGWILGPAPHKPCKEGVLCHDDAGGKGKLLSYKVAAKKVENVKGESDGTCLAGRQSGRPTGRSAAPG